MTNLDIGKERMRKALTIKPHSVDQLAGIGGVCTATVRRWLARMSELQTIYVAGYGEDSRGRSVVELWRWGNEPSAPRPGRDPAKSAAKARRLRLKWKKEGKV